MPYTFSHPGYAIYLKKRYFPNLNVSGLVFGSIAPDLDILIRLSDIRYHVFNYSISDVFFIILPLTLVMCFAFHLWVRNTLIDCLPIPLNRQWMNYRTYDFYDDLKRNYAPIILSVLIGIYTHVLLDYLTHWNSFHVMMFFHTGIYPMKSLLPVLFYGAWYLPMTIGTLLGLWLIYNYVFPEKIEWPLLLAGMTLRAKVFWVIFVVIAICIMLAKRMHIDPEEGHYLTEYLIHLTTGILCALYTTPLLLMLVYPETSHDG